MTQIRRIAAKHTTQSGTDYKAQRETRRALQSLVQLVPLLVEAPASPERVRRAFDLLIALYTFYQQQFRMSQASTFLSAESDAIGADAISQRELEHVSAQAYLAKLDETLRELGERVRAPAEDDTKAWITDSLSDPLTQLLAYVAAQNVPGDLKDTRLTLTHAAAAATCVDRVAPFFDLVANVPGVLATSLLPSAPAGEQRCVGGARTARVRAIRRRGQRSAESLLGNRPHLQPCGRRSGSVSRPELGSGDRIAPRG